MRKIDKKAIAKKRAQWAEGERQTLQLLELHPAFQNWAVKMREKYEIDYLRPEGMSGFEGWREGMDEDNPPLLQEFFKSITRFRLRFRLTANYTEALAYYVVTGSFLEARTGKIAVTTDWANEEWVNLRINAPASKEEIMEAVMLASTFLNLDAKRLEDGRIHLREIKRWRPWKYRPNLDRDIRIYSLSLAKKGRNDVNDRDLVAEVYPDDGEDLDIKSTAALDKRRARQLPMIRARVRKAIRERFPTNTF